MTVPRAKLPHVAFYYRENCDAKENKSEHHCFVHLAEVLWKLSETVWHLASVQAPFNFLFFNICFFNFSMTLVSGSDALIQTSMYVLLRMQLQIQTFR